MPRGRYSRRRRGHAELRADFTGEAHRLHCTSCGSWVVEVDEQGRLVDVRDWVRRRRGTMFEPGVFPIDVSGARCPRCGHRLGGTLDVAQ